MLSLPAEDDNAVISLKTASLRVPEQKVVGRHRGNGGVREEERGLSGEGNLAADGSDDGVAEERVHLGLESDLRAEVGLPAGAGAGASPLGGDEEMLAGAA